MINIHLYPSPFLNESRILREAGSLARLGLFDRIDLVGIAWPDSSTVEPVAEHITIVRMGKHNAGATMTQKISKILGWTAAVYRAYRGEKVACINCHSITALPLSVVLKHATGAKLIYDPHELETEANGLQGVRKFITKQVERTLINAVDHHIFVGQAIEDWYRREYGLSNSTVLYNCPEVIEVFPSRRFHEMFRISNERPIFLYQGLLGKGRGLEILVKAFSEMTECAALVIMGYGPLEGWVESQVKEHANIHFHPAVPPAQLLAYTAAADFGLSVIEPTSMSYEYCVPNKLFEYVMARKPVLVSPTIEQRDFVKTHGVGEVADAMTPEAVRLGALRLIERGAADFAAALDRTRMEFCWERQEAKLEAAYLYALGFHPGTGSSTTNFGVAK